MLSGKKVEFIESYIKHGAGDYQWNDNHGELVRCRNCKYMYEDDQFFCGIRGFNVNEEFFCADGVKRDE